MSTYRNIAISAILLFVFGLAGGVYLLGRRDGAAVVRAAARAEQLQRNTDALDTSETEIRAAAATKAQQEQRVDRSASAHQAARGRVVLIDSSHAQLDGGPALELPAPVLATIASSDALIVDLRANVVAADAWGAQWQARAALLDQRVGILEAQLRDANRASRWTVIKAAIVGAAAGALGDLVLRH